MKEWSISYYNAKVKDNILSLPNTLLAKYIKLTALMLKYGANLGMPHTKVIGNNLFELRVKGAEGIARIFYCTVINREIIMLHGFIKKTDKLPQKELKIVKLRFKEVQK